MWNIDLRLLGIGFKCKYLCHFVTVPDEAIIRGKGTYLLIDGSRARIGGGTDRSNYCLQFQAPNFLVRSV